MKPILFVCASDTLVHLLLPVARDVERLGSQVKFATLKYTREKAEFALGSRIESDKYVGVVHFDCSWIKDYSCVVMGNDWGDEARAFIYYARNHSVPSICIQESVIDFSGSKKRMRHSDYAFVQGEISGSLLEDRKKVLVTGNPRYDGLVYSDVKNKKSAFINVNFTYGVEEDNRDFWIKSAISACNQAGLKPLLVQHPRDSADLSVYGVDIVRSNASVVHDIIRSSGVLITRFSSLIHEAICLGRPVCYFDPFSENIYYNFEPDDVVLKKAGDIKSLEGRLGEFLAYKFDLSNFSSYLNRHLLRSNILASKICAERILEVVKSGSFIRNRWFRLILMRVFLLRSVAKDIYRVFF